MAGINDFPGSVGVRTAIVKNSLGENSIKNNLLTVDVYEDIYTPYVYCTISVIDYNKLSSSLPFIGEEYFIFEFETPDGQVVSYQFYLYQQNKGAILPNNKSQGYLLHGVTLERAFDTAKTVSRSYTGNYASIAGQIFDDNIKKDSGLEFNYEPSKSVGRYIPPQISPLSAINYCRMRSVPTGNVYSPYTFFRNSRGYHFISLNSLFQMAGNASENVIHVFGAPSPNPVNSDEQTSAGENTRNDIISFEPQVKYNSMDKIDRGVFNTISYSFDLTTKQFLQRRSFNLSQNKGKFQLGNAGEFNSEKFLASFNDTRCGVEYRPTDFSIELEGTQTDFLPDAIGEMNAYAGLLGQQQVGILLYGDSNITAGQTLTVRVYKPTDLGKIPSVDNTLSGTYLLARVRHCITFGTNTTYELHTTALRGKMNGTIAELQQNG